MSQKIKLNFFPMKASLAILLVVAQQHITTVSSFEMNPSWYSCRVEFKDLEEKVKAITECAEKSKYKLPDDDTLESIQAEMKRLSSSDFEDGCFAKCWYESAGLIKDGKICLDNFEAYYKNSNISEPLLKEYKKLFEECLKETEPKFKDAKEIPCKMYTMVDVCSVNKFEEHKKHLEEICGKGSR